MSIARRIRAILMLIAMLSPLALAACNTMEGAGKDIGAAGDAIDDTARENKPY